VHSTTTILDSLNGLPKEAKVIVSLPKHIIASGHATLHNDRFERFDTVSKEIQNGLLILVITTNKGGNIVSSRF
jgi:hypothetical protein